MAPVCVCCTCWRCWNADAGGKSVVEKDHAFVVMALAITALEYVVG
ncbi:MAG: hypothetical protein ACLSFT_10195 [Ruminococcus callidus]